MPDVEWLRQRIDALTIGLEYAESDERPQMELRITALEITLEEFKTTAVAA